MTAEETSVAEATNTSQPEPKPKKTRSDKGKKRGSYKKRRSPIVIKGM